MHTCINTCIPCKNGLEKKQTCLLKEISTEQINNLSERSSKFWKNNSNEVRIIAWCLHGCMVSVVKLGFCYPRLYNMRGVPWSAKNTDSATLICRNPEDQIRWRGKKADVFIWHLSELGNIDDTNIAVLLLESRVFIVTALSVHKLDRSPIK